MADDVTDAVRDRVHALHASVDPGVAELVALAMVKGAAQGFCEITREPGPAAFSRLLDAMGVSPEALLTALCN